MSFLAIEPAILARLAERIPGVKVLSAEDLEDIDEREQPAPALHVVYSGYSVGSVSPQGTKAMTQQTWLVVVVVKHAGQRATSVTEVKQRAQPLVDAVVDALMGWRTPAAGMKPLQLANGPRPRFRKPFYYFPLAFSATVPVEANPS